MNKLFVLNHKMNLLSDEIDNYINILNIYGKNKKIIIAPSNIYLKTFVEKSCFDICTQNGYYKDSGAYTGEVSFKQLKSLGINYAIIGHSERRKNFKETDEIINMKIKSCISNRIIPILCVGETYEERNNREMYLKVAEQLTKDLEGNSPQKIIIAYEPIWSIGTGITPKPEEITAMINYINEILKSIPQIDYNILYGGSVDDNNISDILNIDHVDGVLIGGASLNIDKLKIILNN